MNLYQILGVSPTDDEATIKKAYYKAVKGCHPDMHPGDRAAEERFKELSAAYRILGDTKKRKQYDAQNGAAREYKNQNAGKTKTYDRRIRPEDFDQMFQNFFSMGPTDQKESDLGREYKNIMDVSRVFEHYMGIKKGKESE